MGKGNLQKTQQKRERNAKKDNGDNAHSILKTKDKAMTIQCKICMTSFLGNSGPKVLNEHVEAKHAGKTLKDCFPDKT